MNSKLTSLRRKLPRPKRIGIIGCQNVAPESVYSLGLSHAVDEILLIGDGSEALLHDVIRLTTSFPLDSPFLVLRREPHWSEKTDIVIVAVGETSDPASPVSNSLARNAELVRSAMEDLRPYDLRGIVLVITSPVDEMTQIAQETSGLPVHRVIGVGGISPWSEREVRLDRKRNEDAATWCFAHGSGGQLMDSCQPDCPYFESILAEFSSTPTGSTTAEGSLDLASCVMQVCDAVLHNEPTVLTISTKPTGEYGIWNVYMTLPCIVSQRGVDRIVEFKRNDAERHAILECARELAATNKALRPKGILAASQGDRK